jgi:hypothetical protein
LSRFPEKTRTTSLHQRPEPIVNSNLLNCTALTTLMITPLARTAFR